MTVVHPWHGNEEAQVRELYRGHQNMLTVVGMLREAGELYLKYERQFVRYPWPHDETWINETDILVGGQHLLEVKGREFSFDCQDSFPYPTALVGNVERWKLRQIPVCSVVVLSEVTKKAFAVPLSTRPYWKPTFPRDKLRGPQSSYEVDTGLGESWEWLVGHLRGDCA